MDRPRARLRRVPSRWLMTDSRLGGALPKIVATMPPRSAVVVRPYALDPAGRDALIRHIRRVARAKRHVLLLAGDGNAAGYDGRHGLMARDVRCCGGLLSMAVHNRRDARLARHIGADAALISPIFTTRSHADARVIGARGLMRLAAMAQPAKAIALGGMNAKRFSQLRYHGAVGWAAIDAWSALSGQINQNRNCVPT